MTTPLRGARGPDLPYELIAGVEPCPGGWLVVSAKLQGITMSPEQPQVIRTFTDLLDYRPPFAVLGLHLPIGLPSDATPGGRSCDRQARKILGWPRSTAVSSPPSRRDLKAWESGDSSVHGLSAITRALLPRIAEAYKDIGSYHQRTIYEVHPELGFYELNGDQPLLYSKRTSAGKQERMDLLRARMPGVERVLTAKLRGARLEHLVDGCADLWTARKIAAKAITRLPENPEWDSEGLRMELVR
ncbi:MAG TPA: DUF429 domain-containing protein [Acidimicrobiales bacterium]|nr:DUF429 domain-containing protein [Acidimicrobiales bacterium]